MYNDERLIAEDDRAPSTAEQFDLEVDPAEADSTQQQPHAGGTAFRITLFVLSTVFITTNGISFPLALSGDIDMTSFTIFTQFLYAVIFAFIEIAMDIVASFLWRTSPRRWLQQHSKDKEQLTAILRRQQCRRWLVRGAAEWYDHRHMVSLGFLVACNALMTAYGGSPDRTPLTIQAAMNMLVNILGVRLKITVFGLTKELPWFASPAHSKFHRYYYGSALCFTVAVILVIIDRNIIAKVPDGQLSPLVLLYALGNGALVVYSVVLDKMLGDAAAAKAEMAALREQQWAPVKQAAALPSPKVSPVDTSLPVISYHEERRIRARQFNAKDEPRSPAFNLYAHVHRTVAILRRVQLAGLLFVLLLALFALIPGLDQAGTLSVARIEATLCPLIGMNNLYVNVYNLSVVIGFIATTILNEIDASLVMTAANASQIMELAAGWIPFIGPVVVGYTPNVPATLFAMAFSVVGVWCAQRYSLELCRIAAEVQKKKQLESELQATQ